MTMLRYHIISEIFSFKVKLSYIYCLFLLCLAAVIGYYSYTASANDKLSIYHPYSLIYSVLPAKYSTYVNVVVALFFTYVYYTCLYEFYEFCLDDDELSFETWTRYKIKKVARQRRQRKVTRK